MNELDKVFAKSLSGADFARGYATYLGSLLHRLDFEQIGQVIQVLDQARAEGKTIFFVGNGGSAAAASHFAVDFGIVNDPEHGVTLEHKPPFRVVSLADSVPWLTAVANDTEFDNVFVRQLRNLLQPGDIVLAISASGNSPNVVKAVQYSNGRGGISIAFVGFDGGALKQIAKCCVHIETPKSEYGPVEDVQLVLCHMITNYLRFCFNQDR